MVMKTILEVVWWNLCGGNITVEPIITVKPSPGIDNFFIKMIKLILFNIFDGGTVYMSEEDGVFEFMVIE